MSLSGSVARKLTSWCALSVLGVNAAFKEGSQLCPATFENAGSIANELVNKYWDPSTGQFNDGELWTDANTLEDLHNYMLITGSNAYANMADTSYIGMAALNPRTNWTEFFGGSYDDAQWVILALWKISDYKASRKQDNAAYMSSSLAIYDMVAAEWDDTCGGGVWWSSAHSYKNAITNELFLLTSAEAFLRTSNQTYLDNANKEYTWLMNSGMRGLNGLFNDGLDLATCKNNNATAWTYNKAVVASGLGALYAANRSTQTNFLENAQVSLDATMNSSLTYDNTLKESCDDAEPGSSSCDQDQQLFKGLWMKHVQYFLNWAGDASITSKYSDFLWSQYDAVYHNAMDTSYDVDLVWYAPNQGNLNGVPKRLQVASRQ